MAIDKKKRDTFAGLAILVAMPIVIFANLVADRAFKRWDLTEEQRYSLTEPFQKVLGRLEAPLQLTYYVSSTWPNQYQQLKRDILDKLEEIKSFGRGMIELRIVDPLEDSKARKKLQEAGVEQTIPEIAQDRVAYSVLYSTLEATYSRKPSVLIPLVEHADDLEYLLANRILELTLEKKPIIALHLPPAVNRNWNPTRGGRPITGFEWILKGEEDERKFDVRGVDLNAESPIPEGAELLVLVNPPQLSERAQYEVQKYLAEGGKVFLIATPWTANIDLRWRVEETPTGLEDFLENLGIAYGKEFVCDTQNVRIAHIDQFTQQMKQEKLWPFVMILPQNYDQDQPFLRFLPPLAMPFPAELILDEKKLDGHGLGLNVLARTSERSWREPRTPVYRQAPDDQIAQRTEFNPNLPVWIRLTGQFPFEWDGKPAPAWPDDEEAPGKPRDPATQTPANLAKKPGMLMLWACPNSFHGHLVFSSERDVAAHFVANRMLLTNLVETFSLGEELTQLRSKRYETRTIRKFDGEGEDTKRNVLKALMIAGVPLVLIALAMVRFFMRRADQVGYERKFSETTGPSNFTP
ncbi:MAG: GldG family protein [Planctomycetota bacterium]|nr:GldG family protein [Planctomycetota bacterium]